MVRGHTLDSGGPWLVLKHVWCVHYLPNVSPKSVRVLPGRHLAPVSWQKAVYHGGVVPESQLAFRLFLLPAGVFVSAMNSAVLGEFIAPGEVLFAAWECALILILSQCNVS